VVFNDPGTTGKVGKLALVPTTRQVVLQGLAKVAADLDVSK